MQTIYRTKVIKNFINVKKHKDNLSHEGDCWIYEEVKDSEYINNPKYELINDPFSHSNRTLYRIRALRDFGDVKKGDLGGCIAYEGNLSHYGDCWVYGRAKVYDNAKVYGNAWVYGNAEVFDNAEVYGNAMVYGNLCWVYGNARVYQGARVYGNAKIFDNAEIFEYASVYGEARIFHNFKVAGETRVY